MGPGHDRQAEGDPGCVRDPDLQHARRSPARLHHQRESPRQHHPRRFPLHLHHRLDRLGRPRVPESHSGPHEGADSRHAAGGEVHAERLRLARCLLAVHRQGHLRAEDLRLLQERDLLRPPTRRGGSHVSRWTSYGVPVHVAREFLNKKRSHHPRICSTLDGLPRVFTTNENLRGSIIPGAFLFIYITGWIGWVGREYLNRTADPMKELILDMPLVARCMLSGFAWPVASWQSIVKGTFVQKTSDFYKNETC